ncbi:MAG: OB-fold nucleic acid binding domain-containing protein [Candidatus Saliniplasma sp.]
MPDIEELHEMVDDLYSLENFKELIIERQEEYDDLFDMETVGMMLVSEKGRYDSMIKDICELKEGEEATISAEVVDLGKLRTFDRNGSSGKVRNVRLDDGTASVKLVLWDEETERVGEEIVHGSSIKVINGYVQDKGYGLQIQPGKWGEVRVDGPER